MNKNNKFTQDDMVHLLRLFLDQMPLDKLDKNELNQLVLMLKILGYDFDKFIDDLRNYFNNEKLKDLPF